MTVVNLSGSSKKRIIPNKIFLIIFVIYISSIYILNYIYPRMMMTLYIIIPLAIIGFIVIMNGLSRYAEYEKNKYHGK